MGIEYFKKTLMINDSQIHLKIWDTAGQEQFSCLTRNFYKNSSGIIIVYDVSNKDSFDKVKYWIEKARENSEEKTKIILIGNKIDLSKKVSNEKARKLCKENNIMFFETSAKENIGINEAIENLIIEILKENLDNTTRASTKNNCFRLSSVESEIKGNCRC